MLRIFLGLGEQGVEALDHPRVVGFRQANADGEGRKDLLEVRECVEVLQGRGPDDA